MPIYQHDLPQPPRVRKPTAVEVAQFGGLRLDVDPQELGWQGATDLLNVDFDAEGRVRQRDGYAAFVTAPATAYGLGAYPASNHLLVSYLSGPTTSIRAVNSSAATVATVAAGSAVSPRISHAVIGIVTGSVDTQRTYIAVDGLGDIWRYNGSSFVTVALGDAGGPLALAPTDNRLVRANESTVRFSAPGAPETFGTNDYVQLTPGDAERVVSLVAWRDLIFAFKQSKFFVFYGNSTDASGNPVFNYRTVNAGAGVSYNDASGFDFRIAHGAAAAKDGVYFVHDTGVYRTTGGPPELISQPLGPLFSGKVPTYSSLRGPAINGDKTLSVVGDKLYLAMDDGTNTWTFVYDIVNRWWSALDIAATAMLPYSAADRTELAFVLEGSAVVHRFGAAYTTDNGSAITSRYRTGFADLGTPGAEKIMREVLLDGTGNVGVSVMTNDSAAVTTAATVALGTAPAVANNRRRSTQRGRNFSVQFGSVSGGAWSLHRAVGHFRGERPAGITSG